MTWIWKTWQRFRVAAGAPLVGFALLAGVFSSAAFAQPFVYVTHEKSNDVWVINARNDELHTKVPVGERPRGVVVSSDGSRIYVANGNSNDISVIVSEKRRSVDPASTVLFKATMPSMMTRWTHTVVDTFSVGIDPEGIDLSSDETRLFVVNENEGVMRVVDLASKQVVATVQAGIEPETVVISPDGKLAFVPNETSHDVTVVDAETYEVVTSIKVGENPRGVVFMPDGKTAYVSNERSNTVSVIDVEQLVVSQTLEMGERPVGLSVLPDASKVYVVHGRANDVRVLDPTTNEVVKTVPLGGKRCWWSALTPDGKKLYATMGRSDGVAVIDTATDTLVKTIAVGSVPWGVAVTP